MTASHRSQPLCFEMKYRNGPGLPTRHFSNPWPGRGLALEPARLSGLRVTRPGRGGIPKRRSDEVMASYQYIYVMKGLGKTYPGGRQVL